MTSSARELAPERVIDVTGVVTPATVIELQREIAHEFAAGDCRVVIDLGEVTLMGGRTAALLCGALRRLDRTGLRLTIVGGPSHVEQLLQILWRPPPSDQAQPEAEASDRHLRLVSHRHLSAPGRRSAPPHLHLVGQVAEAPQAHIAKRRSRLSESQREGLA